MAELSETEKYASVLSSGGPSPLAKLLGNGQRPMRIVDFPGERGKGVAVGIWNLLQYETVSARFDAIDWIQRVCKVPDSALLVDTSLAKEETTNQLLFRALRDHSNPACPFAATVNELRTLLTPDERDALYDQYLDFVDERSPLKKLRSEDEVNELTAALGKVGSQARIWLASLDVVSLRSITLSLAEQALRLMRENSSRSGTASPLASVPLDETRS